MGVLSGVKGHSPVVASNSHGQACLRGACSGGWRCQLQYNDLCGGAAWPFLASEAKNSTVSMFPEGGWLSPMARWAPCQTQGPCEGPGWPQGVTTWACEPQSTASSNVARKVGNTHFCEISWLLSGSTDSQLRKHWMSQSAGICGLKWVWQTLCDLYSRVIWGFVSWSLRWPRSRPKCPQGSSSFLNSPFYVQSFP